MSPSEACPPCPVHNVVKRLRCRLRHSIQSRIHVAKTRLLQDPAREQRLVEQRQNGAEDRRRYRCSAAGPGYSVNVGDPPIVALRCSERHIRNHAGILGRHTWSLLPFWLRKENAHSTRRADDACKQQRIVPRLFRNVRHCRPAIARIARSPVGSGPLVELRSPYRGDFGDCRRKFHREPPRGLRNRVMLLASSYVSVSVGIVAAISAIRIPSETIRPIDAIFGRKREARGLRS